MKWGPFAPIVSGMSILPFAFPLQGNLHDSEPGAIGGIEEAEHLWRSRSPPFFSSLRSPSIDRYKKQERAERGLGCENFPGSIPRQVKCSAKSSLRAAREDCFFLQLSGVQPLESRWIMEL